MEVWPATGASSLCSRLAPVLKTIFHQCVVSKTCSLSNSDGSVLSSLSNSDGSVLKQSHQSKTSYKLFFFLGGGGWGGGPIAYSL